MGRYPTVIIEVQLQTSEARPGCENPLWGMKCQAPKRASTDTVNGESQRIEWLIVNGGTVSPTFPAHSMQLTKEVHWTCDADSSHLLEWQ